MIPIQTTIIRPYAWRPLIPLAISIFMIFVIGPKSGSVLFTILGIVFGIISILLWIFLKKTSITIDNQGFVLKTMIGSSEFEWANLTNTYIKYQRRGKSGSNFWHFETTTGKPVSFSIRDYSKKDLQLIAEVVMDKAPVQREQLDVLKNKLGLR